MSIFSQRKGGEKDLVLLKWLKKTLRAQKWRFLVNNIFVEEKPNKIVSRSGGSYTDNDFGLLWSNAIVSRDYNAKAGCAFSSFAGASVLRWRRSELLLCDRWSFGRACNRRRSESHQNNLLWGFIDLSERQCLKKEKRKTHRQITWVEGTCIALYQLSVAMTCCRCINLAGSCSS